MENYIIRQQKKLRTGFTTGTCAAAAAKAAAQKLLTGIELKEVTVRLPSGERVRLAVYPSDHKDAIPEPDRKDSEYFCIKDAGDDPDVTDKAEICACVQRISDGEIPTNAFSDPDYPNLALAGGEGVGTVTKPGLEQKVGQAAINRVPRQMIFRAVQEILDDMDDTEDPDRRLGCEPNAGGQKLLITIRVPAGRELAKKTFNPKLGIENGISILGTTGIVEPMSEAALVATIEAEVRQTIAQGQKHLIFVPGNYGEKYVRNELKMTDVRLIQCSNYIGEAIDLAVSYGAESILFVGNFGKLVKIAAGIMNTHSRYADGRWEIIVSHAALQQVPVPILWEIRNSVTTDQMLSCISGKEQRQNVVNSILNEIQEHLEHRSGKIPVGAAVYSEQYGLLGKTGEVWYTL